MKKLNRIEEMQLEIILKREKQQAEEFLKNNENSFEAYFVKNETLPAIENLLSKLEI